MGEPYWSDDQITLYLGDCREVTEWLTADVLVTDPPYGIGWEPGTLSIAHGTGIAGDLDTEARDTVLAVWGDRCAVIFGDFRSPVPTGSRQVLLYGKPPDSGTMAPSASFRRDVEAIYLTGPWTRGYGGRSAILRTSARSTGSQQSGMALRYGHPHAKPVDVLETLIAVCPRGTIADPFAGSGNTLVAARNQGRRAWRSRSATARPRPSGSPRRTCSARPHDRHHGPLLPLRLT